MMSNEQRTEYLAALRVEREGHMRAGDDARVKAVDVEIRRVEGHVTPRQRAERRPRTRSGRQTR